MSSAKIRAQLVTRQHRWRAKTRHLINLRVCMLCKHAFISGRGSNICLDCTHLKREDWKARHPHRPAPDMIKHESVRVMMVRSNLVCPVYRASVNPAIPVPKDVIDNWHFKEAVDKTFAAFQPYPLGKPILGWPPFPHLKFEGFKTGRPQEKVRRLR